MRLPRSAPEGRRDVVLGDTPLRPYDRRMRGRMNGWLTTGSRLLEQAGHVTPLAAE